MGQFAPNKPNPLRRVFCFLGLCMSGTLDHLAQSTEAAFVSKAAIVGGSAGSVIFGFSADAVGVVAGIMIGLIGLGYNIWATERRLRILKSQHEDQGE